MLKSQKRKAASPKENTSKKTNMATGSTSTSTPATRSVFETNPDQVVKIELVSINDKPFYGQISDEELIYIWTSVFLRKKEELYGVSSTRSLSRLVRAKFRLNAPKQLSEIVKAENFSYEKTLKDGKIEKINGIVLGFNKVKPIELGKRAHIHIKTNFGVEIDGVANWLRIFGSVYRLDHLVNDNTGLRTDVIEAEVVLREHLPEFLPMYGQKVQIQYPGVLKICVRCYGYGHYRNECNNKQRNWIEYAIQLVESKKINIEYVGTWKNAFTRWRKANEGAENEEMDV